MRSPLPIGVLGSGKGSNFHAIAEAIDAGTLHADARERGLRAEYLPPGRFKTKLEPEAEDRLVAILKEAGAEWVVLAGYMRMIKAPLLDAFPRRIINIPPSLLPQFPGLEAWKQALTAGAAETG